MVLYCMYFDFDENKAVVLSTYARLEAMDVRSKELVELWWLLYLFDSFVLFIVVSGVLTLVCILLFLEEKNYVSIYKKITVIDFKLSIHDHNHIII